MLSHPGVAPMKRQACRQTSHGAAFILSIAALLAVSSFWNIRSAGADIFRWKIASGGNWHTSPNWDPNGIPDLDDNVIIGVNDNPYAVDFVNMNDGVANLEL